MAEIKWDKTGEHFYETGVDHGVLYVWDPTKNNNAGGYGTGVAWNGLISISENPSGAEPTALWADNIKYLNLMSAEEFGCTIEAYTYPDQFMKCDGTEEPATGVYLRQQNRATFALCYRTLIGNDTQGNDLGYKIHIIYGCLASPSERSYSTVNDSPEAITFSWEVTTTPVEVTVGTGNEAVTYKPTSYLEIDSRTVDSTKLTALLAQLYGSGETAGTNDPTLLMPADIIDALD